jgi:hypothetical protein
MALGNGERYYSPALGRFQQEDSFGGSLGLPTTLNRHAYVSDNPLRYLDPTGLAQQDTDAPMLNNALRATGDKRWWIRALAYTEVVLYAVEDSIFAGAVTREDRLLGQYQNKKIGAAEYFIKSLINQEVSAGPAALEVAGFVLTGPAKIGSMTLRLLARGGVGAGGSFVGLATSDTLNWAFFGDSFSPASEYLKAAGLGFLFGMVAGGVDELNVRLPKPWGSRVPGGATEAGGRSPKITQEAPTAPATNEAELPSQSGHSSMGISSDLAEGGEVRAAAARAGAGNAGTASAGVTTTPDDLAEPLLNAADPVERVAATEEVGYSIEAGTEATPSTTGLSPREIALRDAVTDSSGRLVSPLERKGLLFTIRRVETLGYRLRGAIKYSGNQGIDLFFEGVDQNAGRFALAEAKASPGLGSLATDASEIRQGSRDFFMTRLERAGRADLVTALRGGNVDLFGGFAGSGRLFEFNPNVFTRNESLRTRGAVRLIP